MIMIILAVANITFEVWHPEIMFRPFLLHRLTDGSGWDKLGEFVFPAVVSWKQIEINYVQEDKSNYITFLLLVYADLQSERRCWIVLLFLMTCSAELFLAPSGGLFILLLLLTDMISSTVPNWISWEIWKMY